MRPADRDLDEEIRGHLALNVKDRIDAGEDPASARYAAIAELGSLMAARESMRAVWRNRWTDAADALAQDVRVAMRSLMRARGFAITVVLTLALGIGANAALFSVVRQVLLLPLANRDEDRLIYIRQSAPGLGAANTTFSVPEIEDLRSRASTVAAFGDFSTIDFTMIGFGEPRVVMAGVVSGSYFEVMGLRPVLGRLIDGRDDGPDAAPVAVLTYRFWSTSLNRDPGVIGRTVRLGSRDARVVGVLEPSVPYPADTGIIANVVTSPHHLGATMVTERTHRMTELFGRLAPGRSVDAAREDLVAAHAAMMREHPEAYPTAAGVRLTVTPLRDQITAPARTVLLGLLAAAALVFVIGCANAANLILARSVRRERELAVRAALGASAGVLRRTLFAESLVLCGGGAILGVLLARPLVTVFARYASRFSVRALDVTVDATLLWVGAALALVAAVVLAYVPRLPPQAAAASDAAGAGTRPRPGTLGRLRGFAVAQIALSFVLLAGAALILSALLALQAASTGFTRLHHVLALDVPLPLETRMDASIQFYEELMRRIGQLPGVRHVAVGNFVPWRDAAMLLPSLPFSGQGYTPADGEDDPHARLRNVTPGFFTALGVPILAGRDFSSQDGPNSELVVIVSWSVARRLFPDGDAVGRYVWWTSPLFENRERRRIVGLVPDIDDENVVPAAALTIYHPLRQIPFGGRVFVHAAGDPYALVAPVTGIIRDIAPLQPVERPATLADVRAQVLAPERLNAFVFSVFAGVALLIAVIGVGGVLAFSVSARRREFGIRLAVGASRRRLLARVLLEAGCIALTGIAAGAAGGYLLGQLVAGRVEDVALPGGLALLGAASVLMGSALVASIAPAARAARVDVVQALRLE